MKTPLTQSQIDELFAEINRLHIERDQAVSALRETVTALEAHAQKLDQQHALPTTTLDVSRAVLNKYKP